MYIERTYLSALTQTKDVAYALIGSRFSVMIAH